jgi:hypothetical protein
MDCFTTSGRFPCHIHIRFVPNNSDDANSHQRMVVNTQDANLSL